MRTNKFDLQYAFSKILPLIGAYVLLAHYTACFYWAVALWEFEDTPVATNSSSVLEQRPPTNSSGATEWLPTAAYMEYGSMVRFYLRALYFGVCNLTGVYGQRPGCVCVCGSVWHHVGRVARGRGLMSSSGGLVGPGGEGVDAKE